MRRIICVLLLMVCGVSASAQSWVQVTSDAGSVANLTGIPATTAGNLNVLVVIPVAFATPYPLTAANVSDNKGQTWTQDGACSSGAGDPYVCVFYVCSGVGGVTSISLSGISVAYPHDIYFAEGTGTISTNCAGAYTTASGGSPGPPYGAPTLISVSPDESSELGIVGIGCNGNMDEDAGVTGTVNWSNLDDASGNILATAIISGQSSVTAQNGGSTDSACTYSDEQGVTPNHWNGAIAMFRTQQPSGGSCPTTAPVPSIAGCAYSQSLGTQAIGSATPAQAVSVDIAAGTTVGSIAVLTGGIAGNEFANAAGSSCTATTYAAATSCAVNVSFSPLVAGLRRGAVVFYSGANNTGTALAWVPIAGIGSGPQLAFGPGGAQSNVGSGFISPAGLAIDGAGDLLVADPGVPAVYKVAPGGGLTVVGSGFSKPAAAAVDGAGNVYVADSGAAAVYEVTPGGTQTAVGSGFNKPVGIAIDGAGNAYVADAGKAAVYEVTPGGAQTEVGSGFISPAGVAVDAAGDVYVADSGAPGVYEVTVGGTTTPVGSGFSQPQGVALDAAGNVYVTDAGTKTLYAVSPSGAQTSVSSGFDAPIGLTIDGAGNLYVTNSGKGSVVKIDRADAPSVTFLSTGAGSTSTDSPRVVELEDIGNAVLTLTALTYPSDFPEGDGDVSLCTTATGITPAEQCDIPITFMPQSVASLSESVTLIDNALNVMGAKQSIAVSGTGTAVSAMLNSPAPGAVLAGTSVNFSWTASAGATTYSLWLGSTGVGSVNLYCSHAITATSITATGLPTNGETIYARLYTIFNGKSVYADYTFTAATQVDAAITSPLPSTTLTGAIATFTWSPATAATAYSLWLGSTGIGSGNLYSSHAITATSITAKGLPTNGETIYARLYTIFNGRSVYTDYTFTAATQVDAAITSPLPSTTLTGAIVTFTWSPATGATAYSLWLGSTGVGSGNLYCSHATTATSVKAIGLPTNGETIYARLYTIFNGRSVYTDYTYTAQ